MRLAVAVGVRLGWEETNRPVPVRVSVEDDDGNELVRIEAQVNVGRPTHLPPGSTQPAQIAANLPVTVPRHGGYRVVAGRAAAKSCPSASCRSESGPVAGRPGRATFAALG